LQNLAGNNTARAGRCARLLIKGIRSFSPEHGGVITFPKPLTLIVGRNGSGKTVRDEGPVVRSTRRLSSRADHHRVPQARRHG
jgi:hypothetical protein